jgi:hypothetical protein
MLDIMNWDLPDLTFFIVNSILIAITFPTQTGALALAKVATFMKVKIKVVVFIALLPVFVTATLALVQRIRWL